MDYEIVIIGCGVVGLAVAATLSGKGAKVLCIERNESFGMETSSRNSEVIHAGIYYPTGSLKAQLCVEGNELLYDWCLKNKVPHNRIGKYIIAVTKDEESELDKILTRAKNNGVKGIVKADLKKLNSEEPNVRAVSALWSPDTGIIDSHSLMSSFYEKAKEQNCDFAFRHTVTGLEKLTDGFKLTVREPDNDFFEVTSQMVINSAGLESDTIASLAGIDLDKNGYRLNYVRGHYFRIVSTKKSLVNHLIYPAPLKNIAGLGIHITKELDGSLKLGPDVLYLNKRELDYSVPEELHPEFFKAASLYLKGLSPDDIYPDQSGIRPKLQTEGGSLRDFIIREENDKGLPGFYNLIGIESPGLTSCPAIAKLVKNMIYG